MTVTYKPSAFDRYSRRKVLHTAYKAAELERVRKAHVKAGSLAVAGSLATFALIFFIL